MDGRLEVRVRVTLKVASSLDGCIATASGESQWITCAQSREDGHRLRAEHDAILVGVGTVLADDPRLTCRLSGVENADPVPVILDTNLRSPARARVFGGARRAIVYTGHGADDASVPAEVIPVDRASTGGLSLVAVLRDLCTRGVTSLLVEGGAEVARAFIDGGHVTRMHLYLAPTLIPGGMPWLAGAPLSQLGDASQWKLLEVVRIGDDVRLTLEPRDIP